ncbi:DUF4266 domain-containing protein [Lacinutrix neustonica]|uniref:DUF4266 domain-containing protein n=1 Tax=Lacinutrix neustonica TaxID=2980107 RepID=A0A9E8SE23_9FLAO|nr:DUF4266 domain-containing protein [Lacinutrix neustonica]WAC02342.1 DUF4266 domain-containing protein [Lacinutrix neustonica]
MKRILAILVLVSTASSCFAVKEFEKININDPDMVLSQLKINKSETTFQSYREAAAGANGGKTGGGCGCN